jgi:undecaprenyl-diphosphatase
MDYQEATWKGILQGFTEFLPISSSGHLVLLSHYWKGTPQTSLQIQEEILLDLLFHVGTLLAVFCFFYREIFQILRAFFFPSLWKSPQGQLWQALLIATLPTGIIGICLSRSAFFEQVRTPWGVGIFLLFNSLILGSTRSCQGESKVPTWKQAFCIGILQGIAVFPGISRSGSTIACALWLGISRKQAGEFSFLLAIPTILGAALLKFKDIEAIHIQWGPALWGTFISFIIGFLALAGLIRFLQKGKLYYFSGYCFALALFSILSTLL